MVHDQMPPPALSIQEPTRPPSQKAERTESLSTLRRINCKRYIVADPDVRTNPKPAYRSQLSLCTVGKTSGGLMVSVCVVILHPTHRH